jgi:hypothetical protein
MVLRSISHGEKLASIESKMLRKEDLDAFADERRKAFAAFEKEQELRLGELRESMMQTFEIGLHQMRRNQRRMHRHNQRTLTELEKKLNDTRGG